MRLDIDSKNINYHKFILYSEQFKNNVYKLFKSLCSDLSIGDHFNDELDDDDMSCNTHEDVYPKRFDRLDEEKMAS